MGSGGLRGLQIRWGASEGVLAGFDSQALPPFFYLSQIWLGATFGATFSIQRPRNGDLRRLGSPSLWVLIPHPIRTLGITLGVATGARSMTALNVATRGVSSRA